MLLCELQLERGKIVDGCKAPVQVDETIVGKFIRTQPGLLIETQPDLLIGTQPGLLIGMQPDLLIRMQPGLQTGTQLA